MPEFDENGNEIPEPEGNVHAALRIAQREAEEAKARADAAQADRLELAAMKAGLDTDDKMTAFFLSHYDGDPTADAMRQAAVAAGVLPEVDPQTSAAVAAQSQIAQAVHGGETSPLGTVNVGPRGQQHQVPATEAEMWQEFEKAASRQDGQAMLDVLHQYGRRAGGLDLEVTSNSPSTNPIA
jgi:hypothetical protein